MRSVIYMDQDKEEHVDLEEQTGESTAESGVPDQPTGQQLKTGQAGKDATSSLPAQGTPTARGEEP
jgi:hypothetical protein